MNWLFIAAINLTLCIATGAFAAHGLKARLSIEQMAWWQTAVSYHTTHALGLLAIGLLIRCSPLLAPSLPAAGLNTSALLLQLGIVIFSGSLFAMALGAPRWFGAITPIGGLAFMVGWLWLAWAVSR